ncbi:MAG: hypothetical protein ACUVUU_05470 [bacterium]
MVRSIAIIALLIACALALNVTPAKATLICEVQSYDDQGFSPYNNQTVTLTGIVTVEPGIFVPQYTSIYITGIRGDSCGINVFSYSPPSSFQLSLGDIISVTGKITEYLIGGAGATTEIVFSSANDLVVIGQDGPPEPAFMKTGEVGFEQNEGRLVKVTGRVKTVRSSQEFVVDDGSGPVVVRDQAKTFTTDPVWQRLFTGDVVTVTGIVAQNDSAPPYLVNYRIWPRHPKYGDVSTPGCEPDTSVKKVLLEVTGRRGEKLSVLCPDCSEGNNSVTIRFGGPNGGRATLEIYDVAGRRVATIKDWIVSCGIVEVAWDGRNELREALPMGLYYLVGVAHDPSDGSITTRRVPIVVGRRLK